MDDLRSRRTKRRTDGLLGSGSYGYDLDSDKKYRRKTVPKLCLYIFGGSFAVVSLILWLLPCPIEPVYFTLTDEPLPKLESNDLLTKADRLFKGQLAGPESITMDSEDNMYTGLSDGRIVKITPTGQIVDIARTGKPPCGTPDLEPTCGRPLGLRLDKSQQHLIVADAYFGLLQVTIATGQIKTLVSAETGLHGSPFKLTNDLDIASDGTIYFTDSSMKWDRRSIRYALIEGSGSGRLMAYSPHTGESHLILHGLYFANGVQLSPDEQSILIVETLTARIIRYYLKGELEGHYEAFADNLPGLPDNIRPSSKGGYWVGMATARKAPFSWIDTLAPWPSIRKLIAKVINPDSFDAVPKYGLIVELDQNGKILRTLQDPTAEVIKDVSEVYEQNGQLYIGSYSAPCIGKYKL